VSLAVGWLIGKAMKRGSGGIGGKRYQIAAAVLTYVAVSMAEVPIQLHTRGEDFAQLMNPGRFVEFLVNGLTSPFSELRSPFNGIIGLIILAVGINIAWKLTAGPKLEISGPFRASSVGTLPTSAA
jgi:hypothetical protein